MSAQSAEDQHQHSNMSDNSDNSDGGDEFHSLDDDEDYEDEEMSDEENSEPTIFPHPIPTARLHQLVYSMMVAQRQNRPHILPKYEYPVPCPAGADLMRSGDFGLGSSEMIGEERKAQRVRRKSLSSRLLHRELGLGGYTRQRMRTENSLMAQDLLPSTKADFVIHSNHRCYSGQFSDDGNFFYSCSQDFKVRVYDTSNPYKWRYIKSLEYWAGQWTLTDATHSPDGRFLAYTSISPTVYLSSTQEGIDEDPVQLDVMNRGGIWSIRFSGDGRELVAGSSDNCLYVYDIERRKTILKLAGHRDDVNAVCYGDKNSPHILYSGSDDTTVKVWDRRSMADGREVGVFTGHLEGITYVDSKGDGRYVLSNGKDQTMKLWDIRNMLDRNSFDRLPIKDYSSGFDYRDGVYTDPPRRHPADKSLVTFRGHSVTNTLIRCHFSPATSTGGRYVYTGSADGKVAIYNLDATRAGTVDVHEATKRKGWDDGYDDDPWYGRWRMRKACVRDVSWHPSAPVLVATSWAAGNGRGTISVHTWNEGKDDDDGYGGGREETMDFTPVLGDIYATDDESDDDYQGARRTRRRRR